jgi:hypothetical protein
MQTHQQPAAATAAFCSTATVAAAALAGSAQVLALIKKGKGGPLAILHTHTGQKDEETTPSVGASAMQGRHCSVRQY